ncbi:ABC transporter substrate-binding protein [Bradyrhizobium aeschynomenes]|uniref:ABC transporter substrate-binding protein n=1 Tax=Bradyrhizobium aeschynomenes TaxID=2734909 RepID=UPI001AEE6B08|nr:ABC transporter substrate-binding protein [Bradyrhizobium aeschynomenes]
MGAFTARAYACKRRAIFAAAVAVQVALGLSPVWGQSRSETARVVWPFETSSLDAAGAGVQRSTWGVSWHVYDRLVTFALDQPRDNVQQYRLDEPRGDIAERWDISEDGKVYRFHLRSSAAFHDGSQVTAEDVKWSLQRAISLPTTRFVLNLGGLASEDQIKAIDAKTVEIALTKPNRYLLLSLSTPFAPIINANQVKSHLTPNDPWGTEWLKSNEAGSGAYQVMTFRPDQVVLQRNDKWHGAPQPAMRWAVFQTVPEDTTRVALVERRAADVAVGLTPNAIEGVERRAQARLLLIPMPNQFEFLVMNTQAKPFDDLRVRQAIAHAIPQEDIFRSVFLNRGKRLFGPPEQVQGASFPQPQSFAYDPELARKLLAEAGYPNGFDTTLSLCTCKAEYFENLAVALKDHLARAGIRVTIEKLPGARFGELQTAKQMPAYLENQVAWLNLPDYWIRIFYRGNTRSNFSGYNNPALDPLLAKADDAGSDADYDAAMREMIAIVNRDVPLLMFRQAALEVVIGKDIGNYAYWFHTLPDVRSMTRN